MRKRLFILILMCGYLFNSKMHIVKIVDYSDWNYAYSYAIIKNNEKIACRMADLIIQYSIEKKLEFRIITRKVWKETKFQQHEKSYRCVVKTNNNIISTNKEYIAYGWFQVNLNVWDFKLYYTYNKRYAERLINNPKLKYSYIFFLGVNSDIGTDILRHYLDKYDNNYAYALTSYWAGPGSTNFQNLKNKSISNHYILDILNESLYNYKMKIYNKWKYVEYKKSEYKMIFDKDEYIETTNNIRRRRNNFRFQS